jgi:hypothetical protein
VAVRARSREHQLCLRSSAIASSRGYWLAGRQAGHTADEHVGVVADVEFFEQRVQQPSGQRKTARAFG